MSSSVTALCALVIISSFEKSVSAYRQHGQPSSRDHLLWPGVLQNATKDWPRVMPPKAESEKKETADPHC